MREYVLDAIVLHAQDYKDNNKILTLLSSEGKISATCKGINKQASKLKMVACPFCFAEFSLIEKNIITVSGANIYDTFFALSTNYTNFICASCILDLVKRCPEDNSVLGEMFLPCVNAIKDHDEDLDVLAGGEDVVKPAVADIVGPAVAAKDPDGLADEVVGDREAKRFTPSTIS